MNTAEVRGIMDADTECYQHSMPANHNHIRGIAMTANNSTISPAQPVTVSTASKVCSKCKTDKPFSAYNVDKSRKLGVQNQCRDCKATYHAANREKILQKKRDYHAANADKINAKVRAKRVANPELFAKYDHDKHSKQKINKPAHMSWRAMRNRCSNPKHDNYKHYGARGISVCERWEASYDAFIADMGPRPTDKHQIDRIDNNGNYEPGNCQWLTPAENNAKKPVELSPRRSNKLGVVGVSVRPDGLYTACLLRHGKEHTFHTNDFFEAVCFRKSLEQQIIRGEI